MDNSYRLIEVWSTWKPRRAAEHPEEVGAVVRACIRAEARLCGVEPILPTFRWLPDEHLSNGLLRVSAEVLAW